MRVGLASDLPELVLPSPGTPWLVSAGGNVRLRRGPLAVRVQGAAPRYRVQAGAFSEESAARAVATDLGAKTGLPSSVVFSAEKGLYRVRLGDFSDAASAGEAAARLKAAGVDALASAEPGSAARMTVADGSGAETAVEGDSVEIAPGAEGVFVAVGGKTYRGRLRVLIDPRGALNVVDVVNLEDYLRGVVPAEMGPKRFDEIEALKAQAIAARTYAVDNTNGFAAEGYDLCATPKCQVYGGREAEDPLTDAAVQQTRGTIALWQGKPIHALFTSTCGGATEDVRLVFPGMAAGPYLAGVVCGETDRSTFEGAHVPKSARGAALSFLEWRGWMLSRRAAGRRERATRAAVWSAALRLAGLPPRSGPPASLQPSAVYPAVVAGFGLASDLDVHLTPADLAYAAGPPDPAAALPADARAAFLTLARMKVGGEAGLPPPTRAMTELELDGLLMSVAIRLGGVVETSGRFARRDGGSFVVKTPSGRIPVAADTSVDLARSVEGRWYPTSELALASGDAVGFWKRGGDVLAFWAVESPAGGTWETESTWTEWVRRFSARELAIHMGARLPGTEVRSIDVRRRGRSGRVVEASITTDKATAAFSGFDLRQALQLPELLFTVEKAAGPDGSAEFVFVGRGWGHGVGLCQNGAYGMALAGRTADEILEHYYPGIEIGPATPPGPVAAPSPVSPPAAPPPSPPN